MHAPGRRGDWAGADQATAKDRGARWPSHRCRHLDLLRTKRAWHYGARRLGTPGGPGLRASLREADAERLSRTASRDPFAWPGPRNDIRTDRAPDPRT